MKNSILLCFIIGVLGFQACEKVDPDYQEKAANPELFRKTVKNLTNIIVYDIFSPPVASRVYAYPAIAAYECMAVENEGFNSLAGQLKDFKAGPKPEPGVEYCYPLAAIKAYIDAGRTLIFSETKMDAFEAEILQKYQSFNMPRDVYERSLAYGTAMAKHVMDYSTTDNYAQTRTMPKFSINDEDWRWQPTPPDYMPGIEPHWDKIRPFILDSANMFKPIPPTPFSLDKKSQFYKEVIEVYEAMRVEDVAEKEERTEIAKFWDCNPYVSHHQGHVMFATKKITPGGHWVGITDIATRKAAVDFTKTTESFALVSIALADAFISCWDEKYRSSLVRPETVINKYIDEEWLPTLQTPPFPEYTSGHSVISRAAAIALTSLYGDNFQYIDSVEVEYGLPVRTFNSFKEASEEAAVSRLYGGIHYRPAIDEGVKQGEKVGNYVVENLVLDNK